jgi:HEAT repeat protein
MDDREKPWQDRRRLLTELVEREKAFHDVKRVVAAGLKDREPAVRAGAVIAFAVMAPKDAAPALAVALHDPEAAVRAAAVGALNALAPKDAGRFLPAVEGLMDDRDAFVRIVASRSGWALGRSKKAIRAATALLDNPDKSVRAYSAELIGDMGESAASAAPKLVDRLCEPDEAVSLFVGEAVVRLGRPVVEPLLKRARDSRAHIRALAIAFLAEPKVADVRARQAVIAALKDGDPEVRWVAVAAARDLKIRGPAATDGLIALLSDRDEMVCEAAAKALAETRERKAVPALERAMSDRRDLSIREAVAYALGELHATEAIPTLEKVMDDDRAAQPQDQSSGTREAIVRALGKMGPAAIPALRRAARDPDHFVRDAAARSLRLIQLGKVGTKK